MKNCKNINFFHHFINVKELRENNKNRFHSLDR